MSNGCWFEDTCIWWKKLTALRSNASNAAVISFWSLIVALLVDMNVFHFLLFYTALLLIWSIFAKLFISLRISRLSQLNTFPRLFSLPSISPLTSFLFCRWFKFNVFVNYFCLPASSVGSTWMRKNIKSLNQKSFSVFISNNAFFVLFIPVLDVKRENVSKIAGWHSDFVFVWEMY